MDLKLPNLGEGADSGTVVNVFVKEGDQVTKDQPIIELENEKAVASIPATAAGTVSKIYVRAGDKISVGQSILSLADGAQSEMRPRPHAEAPKPTPATKPKEEASAEPQPAHSTAASKFSPAAAPSIRKLARDLGIDLSRVRGSERGGRIVLSYLRADIQQLLSRGCAQPKPDSHPTESPTAAKPFAEQLDFAKWGNISREPLSPLRKVIARRMAESWSAVPRVTQFDEADVTELMSLQKRYAPSYQQKGTRLTLTSFALRVVVETLKKHPILNSSLDETAQEIILKAYFHIGIAVDTEAGLIVPVIRDVDKKDLLQLSKELEELAKKARERKISPEELKGGTFTISNQGGIGGGHFTPIINRPEVAILGLGRGSLKPVVRDRNIEARNILPITLSYDHRIVDGGAAARFIVDLVKEFENFPEAELERKKK